MQQWLRQPQTVPLRKAIFQLHLWSGIGLGLYVLLASVTGSILVFSNELYRAATPPPVIVSAPNPGIGPRLTDDQLKLAATRAWPGFSVAAISRAANPDQAVTLTLRSGATVRNRLFHPWTGTDLGDSVPTSIRLISKLMELHDDLFAGPVGRKVNGFGALLLILIALTGIVVWWPGIRTWRSSLTIHRNSSWRRFVWDLHSMIGFWSLGFILLFGISGFYLGNPQLFQDLADRIQPPSDSAIGVRAVDTVIYWLAYLHFGRVNGIGIPCSGPGFCDTATKAVWAAFGLAPAAMFATGIIMWWNRVIRRKLNRRNTLP